MQHAHPLPQQFPWRAVAVLAAAVALAELVALIAIGLVHLAPRAPAQHASAANTAHAATTPAAHASALPSVPLRPRARTRVLVLNGNGVSGAASAQASTLQVEGYPVAGATNAQRHDYAQSMVMFLPGWQKEARRLARDTHIRAVAPLDGLTRAQLRGAKVILLLGN